MSRDEVIALVEAYLNGLAKKDLSGVPFASDITFEGPRVPKLIGSQSVVGFLTSIMPLVKRIQMKRHLGMESSQPPCSIRKPSMGRTRLSIGSVFQVAN